VNAPVVIIGMGELGAEFARGFLRCGYPVWPVLRGTDMEAMGATMPQPALVLVTVAETDLNPVLASLPAAWRDRVALVQNELSPAVWRRHGLEGATVAVVWFEKKPGRPLTDILFTPVYGPHAALVIDALDRLGVKTRRLVNEDELVFELARKSLYILTLNISSLAVEGSAGEIWNQHRDLARAVALEVLVVLERRFDRPLPRAALIAAMAEGIADCPDRPARGRRAQQRLERILEEAGQAGLEVPVLGEIGNRL